MIHSKIGDTASFPIAELFHPKDIIRDKFRSMDRPFAIKLLLLKDVTHGKFGEADRLFFVRLLHDGKCIIA